MHVEFSYFFSGASYSSTIVQHSQIYGSVCATLAERYLFIPNVCWASWIASKNVLRHAVPSATQPSKHSLLFPFSTSTVPYSTFYDWESCLCWLGSVAANFYSGSFTNSFVDAHNHHPTALPIHCYNFVCYIPTASTIGNATIIKTIPDSFLYYFLRVEKLICLVFVSVF